MQTTEKFQFKCRICGKKISANLKNYKTMSWAIYSHVKSHRLFELFPVPYTFVMNKDLVANFIKIKRIVIPIQTKVKTSGIQLRE
ncbi:MAG: hypothetical protein QW818_03035 [Candidatus Aenigmatarchaeota archaeon]|nr:hypothetical protein [Candidatus Aenigmarchaeota archaeon]